MKRVPMIAFFVGHAINSAGTKMTLVALPLLVYATTGSATRTGAVAFVQIGCYVTAKALGAPLIDRAGRRLVGIAATMIAGACAAGVPALFLGGPPPFVLLLAVLACAGASQGLASGAERVLLPDVATATDTNLERAATVFDGVDRLGLLLGAPIGGVLVAWVGAANVLWFDATSYAVAASLLALAVRGLARPADVEHPPYLTSLSEGWVFLRANRLLLNISIVVALGNMLDQAKTAVLLPVWTSDIAHSPEASGLIYGAAGIGAVGGNLLFIWLAPKLPRWATFAVCYMAGCSTQFFSLALFSDAGGPMIVNFVGGVLSAALNPILAAVTYEQVPDGMRARVFGISGAMAFVGMPFGGMLGGLAVSAFGATGGLWAAGTVYLLITLAPLVFPVWRQMDRSARPSLEAAPA
ncbi:MAG TPA: MFS transporter [Stackebrandtia sp.]|jgi:MFS family permease|uniref:MFS transporter n=1 Tax=Stackebrandtia sp. TaxID=2023065 RepID=UPI002D40BBF6|nr:MFS transporter [Stackebrandtia sp.]HZE42078.1 MFS transporter [Stackebrandtia sp.]